MVSPSSTPTRLPPEFSGADGSRYSETSSAPSTGNSRAVVGAEATTRNRGALGDDSRSAGAAMVDAGGGASHFESAVAFASGAFVSGPSAGAAPHAATSAHDIRGATPQ